MLNSVLVLADCFINDAVVAGIHADLYSWTALLCCHPNRMGAL